MVCRAIYDQCVEEGHGDVVLTYVNQARAGLYKSQWTYADIYESFPFDNIVYIEEVKGSDILYEVRGWGNAYFNPSFDCQINPNSYYKIAVIDYVLFHENDNRIFDYFKAFDGHPDNQLSINYRLIMRKWLKDNHYNTDSTKVLRSSDFTGNDYDRSRLTQI